MRQVQTRYSSTQGNIHLRHLECECRVLLSGGALCLTPVPAFGVHCPVLEDSETRHEVHFANNNDIKN